MRYGSSDYHLLTTTRHRSSWITRNAESLVVAAALAVLLGVTTRAEEEQSQEKIPESLHGKWVFQEMWDPSSKKALIDKPQHFFTGTADGVKVVSSGAMLTVRTLLLTKGEPGHNDIISMVMVDNATRQGAIFRLQNNGRGTWLFQEYHPDTETEMKEQIRARMTVQADDGKVLIDKESLEADPALSLEWWLDPQDISDDTIEPISVAAVDGVDETLFFLYVLARFYSPISGATDVNKVDEAVRWRQFAIDQLLPYMRVSHQKEELVVAFEHARDTCDVILRANENYRRVVGEKAARVEMHADGAMQGLFWDVAEPMANAFVDPQQSAQLPSAFVQSLQKLCSAAGRAAESENALARDVDARIAAAIEKEGKDMANIAAIAAVLSREKRWKPGESGWTQSPPFPTVDLSTKDGLLAGESRLRGLLRQQPKNPFLRAEYIKCVKRLNPDAEPQLYLHMARLAIEAARLVPDGDAFIEQKKPFLFLAVDMMDRASEVITRQKGGWGVSRTFNGLRTLRVLAAISELDAADSDGRIGMNRAWAIAHYGNVELAVAEARHILELGVMDDVEFIYRGARMTAKENPAGGMDLLQGAIEMGGKAVAERARSQAEFDWLRKWDEKRLQSLLGKH